MNKRKCKICDCKKTVFCNTTQWGVAIVSRRDKNILKRYSWRIAIGNRTAYAVTSIGTANKTVPLHKLIISKSKEIDHKDRNGLNCRRTNLRKASHEQNSRNTNSRKGSSSKYLGVYKRKNGTFSVQIKTKGKVICLGTFKSERKAAKIYDKAAKKHHGEFANLNIKG